MPTYISAPELYTRLAALIQQTKQNTPLSFWRGVGGEASPWRGAGGEAVEAVEGEASSSLHSLLVLTCSAGLSTESQSFGNLFSQVDYLCRRHHVSPQDTRAIQQLRRRSNHRDSYLKPEDFLSDCRALAQFISAVFETDIPSELTALLPPRYAEPAQPLPPLTHRCLRCVVEAVDGSLLTLRPDDDQEGRVEVDCTAEPLSRLPRMLRKGMMVNLINCRRPSPGSPRLQPLLVVVEPDFLIDISQLARCFQQYGHSPLQYILNMMLPRTVSQAILLGNYAGRALDDVVSSRGTRPWQDSLRAHFAEQAFDFSGCPQFDGSQFKQDAERQWQNIRGIVADLFDQGKQGFDPDKAILEPTFVCEELGLQGRVDLMTTDFRLLVEQKSGKNFNIERQRPNAFGSYQLEDHYVQLLLYDAMLRRNFNLRAGHIDTKLLYSKYPLPGGLVSVNFYQQLFLDAMQLRNGIVSMLWLIAERGLDQSLLRHFTPLALNQRRVDNRLWAGYQLPQLQQALSPLHTMSPLEQAYFARFSRFVCREMLASRIESHELAGSSALDMWTMPLAAKRETGNIYTDLHITDLQRQDGGHGYDTVVLSVGDQGENFLPNFRQGDAVYLYAYDARREPDARHALLFRGKLTVIGQQSLTVHLDNAQQNRHVFTDYPFSELSYAIEHSDMGAGGSGMRALYELITAPADRRQLLLGEREPRRAATVSLSRSYHPDYDRIVEQAMQARDYYLLLGPPGTGKTSMALQFIVREMLSRKNREERIENRAESKEGKQLYSLSSNLSNKQLYSLGSNLSSLLLMAYTNRAVDEICGMLTDCGIDFLRVGNEFLCAEAYRDQMVQRALRGITNLDAIREKISSARVIVGTTASMQLQASLLATKHFDLAVIDEASQILEPDLIGLLASHRSGACDIDRFILIGDHKQLPAVVQQGSEASRVTDPLLLDKGILDCRQSLFERLLRWERLQSRTAFVGTLSHQGRMHPEVARFPSEAFYSREHLEPVMLKHQQETGPVYAIEPHDQLDRLLCSHRVLFIPSPHSEDGSDKVNLAEANIVADILSRVHIYYNDRFDPQRTVGVIVPYRNQIAMIRREAERRGVKDIDQISIDTVERFQGSQRDVIIYSFTVQHRYQLDFLCANTFQEDGHDIDRKLNVALTRARRQLIMTGNVETLCQNPLFRRLISENYVANEVG